jgi:hypothetical protein
MRRSCSLFQAPHVHIQFSYMRHGWFSKVSVLLRRVPKSKDEVSIFRGERRGAVAAMKHQSI